MDSKKRSATCMARKRKRRRSSNCCSVSRSAASFSDSASAVALWTLRLASRSAVFHSKLIAVKLTLTSACTQLDSTSFSDAPCHA